jgi:hypothetical protein
MGTQGPAVKGGLDLRRGFAEQVKEELVRFLALSTCGLEEVAHHAGV